MRCQLAKIVSPVVPRMQGWLIWVCAGPPQVQDGMDESGRRLVPALRYDIPYARIGKNTLLMIDAEDVELLPMMRDIKCSSFENFCARGGESWPGDAT